MKSDDALLTEGLCAAPVSESCLSMEGGDALSKKGTGAKGISDREVNL